MRKFQDFLKEDGESSAPASTTGDVASNPSKARDDAKKGKKPKRLHEEFPPPAGTCDCDVCYRRDQQHRM
ncbi:hypothetical protein NVP1244A_164 [Vibrio phage 1.244.A._10N.261.54.C3]|nr:hypothetical protein NVP1244A_164 [Vibrio phage 1.244.A._10N.261.54.C3]AUR98792.1 hypothetical protein NVP1255O_164 [Vibrio phage 1.255.O._10N.286.45.F1]